MDDKCDIFISYRRQGGRELARTLRLALANIGYENIFFDYNSLRDGLFNEQIITAINECKDFVLILTPGSMDRCVNENDWVRREITEALKVGCNFVPVLIDEKDVSYPDKFPRKLNIIKNIQASKLLTNEFFEDSVKRIAERLKSKKKGPSSNTRQAQVNENKSPTTKPIQEDIEVHIDVDSDCELYHFKTYIGHMKAYEDNVIHMPSGTHKLYFMSSDLPEVIIPKVYDLRLEKKCDFYSIHIKEDVEKAAKTKAIQKTEDAKLKPVKGRRKRFGFKYGKELYGFVNEKGKVVIPLQWEMAFSFSDGLAPVQNINGKWGFINKTGELVIPCKWESPFFFYEGLAKVKNDNHKWGFIDKHGINIIKCQWQGVEDFSEGLARVQDENRKCGYINHLGAIVIPCIWDNNSFNLPFSINPFRFSEGLAAVVDDQNMWGYIDRTGKIVIPCKWKFASIFSGGIAIVLDVNKKRWKIDKTGKIIEEVK